MVFVDSVWNYWSGKIATIIASVIIGCISIVYIYNIFNTKKTKKKKKKFKMIQAVTAITLLILLINTCFGAILITPESLCAELLFLTWIFFGYYKGGLYVIYVGRLKIAYHGTQYQQSKCLMFTLWFIVIQYFVVFTFEMIYGLYIIKDYDYIKNDVFAVCTFNIPFWTTIHFAFHDVIFPIFCLFLFINPLIKIQRLQKDQHQSVTQPLFSLCVRSTIITFVAIITSIILIIITGIFGVGLLFDAALLALGNVCHCI